MVPASLMTVTSFFIREAVFALVKKENIVKSSLARVCAADSKVSQNIGKWVKASMVLARHSISSSVSMNRVSLPINRSIRWVQIHSYYQPKTSQ